jgi:hypothetical protein
MMKLYTSGSDKKGCILGKQKPFQVKQKVFPIRGSALDAMEQPPIPEMHRNNIIHKSFDACDNTDSRSQSTTGTGTHTGYDNMFHKTMNFHKG